MRPRLACRPRGDRLHPAGLASEDPAVTNGLMAGKRGLVMGLANDKSIAWGIARALHGAGAEIAVSHQGGPLQKRAAPLAERIGARMIECHVDDEASLDACFARAEGGVGHARLRGPRDRVLGQERAARALRRHEPQELPRLDGRLSLLVHRRRPARRRDDAGGRQPADADLLRRREGHAALQCDGRREGRARGVGALHRRGPGARAHPAATRSARARSRRSRRAASATSATS